MFLQISVLIALLCLFPHTVTAAEVSASDHFYNAPENLNPDPNYVPGDFPLAESFAAKTAYHQRKTELLAAHDLNHPDHFFTLDTGDIAVKTIKNETIPVLGYYRNYFGVLTLNASAPEKMDMVIDINSFDTGVPGRNNRILNIFFESANPDFGTAIVSFETFDLNGLPSTELGDGGAHLITAAGTILLNNLTQPVSAALLVQFTNNTWSVKSEKPITFKISDFSFGNRVYDLLKECNHASMGNNVEISVELYFR